MKKILSIFMAIIIVFSLSACEEKEELTPILADDLILMENLDSYMFRDDVQYVDLRNYNAKFSSGYIDGFELIPFFDYLDYRAFDRGDTYEFNPDQILNEHELERLFDREKAIFLYADGCIRSGYLKDVLNYMGFERVYVLGGFYEYVGEYKVLGISNYNFGYTFYSKYESPTTGNMYYMSGDYDMGKKIVDIRFDIVDSSGVSLRVGDTNTQLTILEEFIEYDIVTFNELYDQLTDPNDVVYSNIEGYTYGFSEDFIALIETLYILP